MNAATQERLAPSPPQETGCDAFSLLRPTRALSPVIFASGHSGRNYPAEFVAAARLDAVALRRSEDCFVDQLFAAAPELGAPLLLAHFPRAYCDANREPWELDPAMFEGPLPPWVNSASPRVGAGLGTIARVVSTGEPIYHGKLPFTEAEARVRNCWQPYHAALAALIAETRAQFGVCILIDCHSMPSVPGVYGPLPDMILGDAHGTTCSPRITRMVEQTLTGFGYRLGRNDPYAGGYVTRHYGRPREAVHVLQLELCRKLYMDEAQLRPNQGMERLSTDLTRLTGALVGADWSFLK